MYYCNWHSFLAILLACPLVLSCSILEKTDFTDESAITGSAEQDSSTILMPDQELMFALASSLAIPQEPTNPELITLEHTDQQQTDASPSNLWHRITAGYQLTLDTERPRFKAQYRWYSKHPSYLKRVAQRGERYLHYIVEQAELRGMPTELVLLPIVESAFDPFAYSHGRASGLWQFIPATGREFGLERDWWHDGRRNVRSSTNAALDYLDQLAYRFDGDWLLALASYNAGATTVRRAMRKNARRGLATDFWSLDLPRETRAYVPKLLALAHLIKYPEKANLELPHIADTAYFDEVDIGDQIDLSQVAELADVSLDEVYKLNPSFNRWATHPDGPHELILPIAAIDRFNDGLAALPREQRVKWQRYSVKSGDAIHRLARKFDTTANVIRQVNQLQTDQIYIGQTLLIPTALGNSSSYLHSLPQRVSRIQKRRQPNNTQGKEYVVKPGDSFWKIAKSQKVSVKELARWNNLAPKDPLKVGQKLVVYSNNTVSGRNVVRKINYKIRQGDSLSTVASRFNVRVADLMQWNTSKIQKKYLQPGQQLTLYVDVTR